MKKQFSLFLMLCLSAWALAQIPSNGLVNRFTFNSTLAGTNGHTLAGFTSANYSSDRTNTAASALNITSASQASSSLGIPGLPSGSSARSVSFWYKSNSPAVHSLFNYGASNAYFALAYDGGNSKLIFFNGSTELLVNRTYTSNWQHVVATYTGTHVSLYVNGVLLLNSAIAVNSGSNPISRIGYSPAGTYYGNFQLDDLLIYNRVLTTNEIFTLFSGECTPPPVNTTPNSSLTVCAGQNTTLSVSGRRTIKWYSSSTGGSVLDTGFQFTTPALSANSTYYAETDSAGCTSARTAISVTVIPLTSANPPQILSDTSQPICVGSRALLEAQTNLGTIRWYSEPVGGSVLDTGRYYFSPALSNQTTYYADVITGCGAQSISPRIAIPLKVNGSSDLVNITPEYLMYACRRVFAHPTDLSVQSSANPSAISWRLGYNFLGTGKTFRTPGISADTVFWVTAKAACVSSLSIAVKSFDWATGFTPANLTQTGSTPLCPGDTVTVKASNVDQVPLIWYSSSDQILGWGDSARIALPRNGTFVVKRGSGACASAPTTVQFPVNTVPTATIAVSNDTIRSLNSFDSYVLYRNGQAISSSNSGGSFAIPASCGEYMASFTNTTNTCGNVTAMVRRTQIPAGSGAGCYYYDFQSFTNLQYPAYWSWSLNGQPGEPNVPLNPTGVSSTSNWICPSTGTLTIRIKSANGCEFKGSILVQNLTSIYSNFPGGIPSVDTLTSCTILSNKVNVANLSNGISVSGTAQVCFRNSTSFSASTSRPGNVHWFNSLTATIPVFVGDTFRTPVLDTTSIFYYARSYEGCLSPKLARDVLVYPEIKINLTPTDTTVCGGKRVILRANAMSSSTYTWSSKYNGNKSFGTTWDVYPTKTDTFRLQVTSFGCSKSDSAIIRVNETSINYVNLSSCFGRPLVFLGDTLREAGNYEFRIPNVLGCDSILVVNVQFTNQIQQQVNASICSGQSYRFNNRNISIAGSYRDTLEAAGGCDSIVVLNLQVNALPQPTITQNGAELSTQLFASYQWWLNNQAISGAVSRTYLAQQTGTYQVEVRDNNNCVNQSSPFEVNTVGLNRPGSQLVEFGLSPNPASHEIRLSGLPINCPIQVYDMTGKLHSSSKVSNPDSSFSVQNLNDGLYVLVAEIAGQRFRKQFVISR